MVVALRWALLLLAHPACLPSLSRSTSLSQPPPLISTNLHLLIHFYNRLHYFRFFFLHLLQSDSSADGFHAAECHLTAVRPLGNLSRLIARVLLKLVVVSA